MRLVTDGSSLVIAGAWNAPLLTPLWVLKHGLGVQDDQVQVTVTAPMNMPGPTSYEMPGLAYSVHPKALVLKPPEYAALDSVQAAAVSILRELHHTPIAAVGFNFRFDAEDSEPLLNRFRDAQEDVVDSAPDGWSVAGNNVKTSLSNDGQSWNVTKGYDGTVVFVEFNLHMPATSTSHAINLLEEHPFSSAFEIAKSWASNLLGEELSNDA
jgi:hypothetical protein